MPYTNLVLTAGISAFAPRNILGMRFRETGSPLAFPPGQQNPVPSDPTIPEDHLLATCRDWAAGVQLQPDHTKNISAEYSMLDAIVSHGAGLARGALVHLVHTPSPGGRLAVELQKRILESGLAIQVHAVELTVPFDPAQSGGLALASGAFMGQISRLLRGCDPRHTAFAPIGGYKSMVALGHTAASFHRFGSLYLHEDSQVLQEIAPAPVTLAEEHRTRLSPLARRIGNGADFTAMDEDAQSVIRENPAFFTHVGDLIELNELGQFLRLDETPVLLSAQAKALAALDSGLRNQLFSVRDRAVANPGHSELNHQTVLHGFHGRRMNWNLYKQGHSSLRIAWRHQPEGFLVHHIWTDHNAYERDINVGRVLADPLPDVPASYFPLA